MNLMQELEQERVQVQVLELEYWTLVLVLERKYLRMTE